MSIILIESKVFIHEYLLHLSHIDVLFPPCFFILASHHLHVLLIIEVFPHLLDRNTQAYKPIFDSFANVGYFSYVDLSRFDSLLSISFLGGNLRSLLFLA